MDNSGASFACREGSVESTFHTEGGTARLLRKRVIESLPLYGLRNHVPPHAYRTVPKPGSWCIADWCLGRSLGFAKRLKLTAQDEFHGLNLQMNSARPKVTQGQERQLSDLATCQPTSAALLSVAACSNGQSLLQHDCTSHHILMIGSSPTINCVAAEAAPLRRKS